MEKEIIKIYEDENILLLNKPSGLIVDRNNTSKEETLQDILDREYRISNVEVIGEIDKEIYEDFKNRSGIVHRLDKGTSGIIVIAKNIESFVFLQKQFKERNVYKEYVALVHGRVEEEEMEINAPLARNPKVPLRYAVVSTGRPALTKIEKIKNVTRDGNDYTLLKVSPKTGRTHQIRVHLSAIGHPIVGDLLYCTKKLLEQDSNAFGRLMLHARVLGFSDPKTQKFQRFEIPLPNTFLL